MNATSNLHSVSLQSLNLRRQQDLETLTGIILSWNSSRLDLFELSLPNENLEFSGVMRFYYQHLDGSTDQKVSTKCVRIQSSDNTARVIEILIEKFRPDMKMLEVPEYVLLEIHEFGERRLGMDEKPLLVQLNWHKDDRDGRFLLRSLRPEPVGPKTGSRSFKRSFSLRMKKVFSMEKKISETEMLEKSNPEPVLRRSLTNPDSVLERRKIKNTFKPSPLRLKPSSESEEESGFVVSDQQPPPSILVKIHSELSSRNIPLLVVRLAPLDTAEEVLERVTAKYGLPPATARDCGLAIGSTGEVLGPGDRPYLTLINNPASVLVLRRRHPHHAHNGHLSSQGSSNYSTHSDQGSTGSLGRTRRRQLSPPWQQGTSVCKEEILPAVLEFSDDTEEELLSAVVSNLEPGVTSFKLAPAYILYMATRFRASTLYRPELTPASRAVRLTHFLTQLSARVRQVSLLSPANTHAPSLAFWLANSGELLHFLRADRHVHSYASEAQGILSQSVNTTFYQLVRLLEKELDLVIPHMMAEDATSDTKACAGIISVLSSVMSLLRRSRVNASLTIQIFSHLFHHVNRECFNLILLQPRYCADPTWGSRIINRLSILQQWAEGQGLELAAECHLVRLSQAGRLILADKTTPDQVANLSSVCCNLNSLQIARLLSLCQDCPEELVTAMVRAAESSVDTVIHQETGGRVRLEEGDMTVPLMIPRDNYSCDIVRGVPGGLPEVLAPLTRLGVCGFSCQPQSLGQWNIYMESYHLTKVKSTLPVSCSKASRDSEAGPGVSPVMVTRMQLSKELGGGLGLSIVAARGGLMEVSGIFVKSVVAGSAAARDGRLRPGDQLLEVEGVSLAGRSQEEAAIVMRRSGALVNLTVATGAAQQHGLAHLLAQPSPTQQPRQLTSDTCDTCDTCDDNYQNQEWLAMTAEAGTELLHQEVKQEAGGHQREGSATPGVKPPGDIRQTVQPHDQGGQHYQNLDAIREQASLQARSPRPVSMLVSSTSASAGVHPQVLPNCQSIQNISRDHDMSVPQKPFLPLSSNGFNFRGLSKNSKFQSIQEIPQQDAPFSCLGGSQATLRTNINCLPLNNSSTSNGNFARINSGRFRPIHPATSVDKMGNLDVRNTLEKRSVIRKGPIRKDGSIMLSPPKRSPAPSQSSGSSDKENCDNTNFPITSEEESDSVFVEKEPESLSSEVCRTNQIYARSEKKVSFTTTTVHDVTKDEENDRSRNSLDTIDDPDSFIDGAEEILNLNQIDLHQKISVVGNQEVYNDPRIRIKKQSQLIESRNSSDGSSLSFKDKLKMFTQK